MSESFLNQPVGEFLDGVAAREAAPGGGAAAAVTAAAAAGLAAMAARFSVRDARESSAPEPTAGIDDAAALADRADRLRRRVASLADEDAAAYRAVLDAYAMPKEADPQGRRDRIRAALRRAAEVPLRIAEVGAEVAGLGARLVEVANPNLRGDALVAVLLADAATRSAAGLVRINVDLGKLDEDPLGRELLDSARRCEAAAGEAVRRVSTTPGDGDRGAAV